jgi:diguanylate cyclase (GGDEF)-like protein
MGLKTTGETEPAVPLQTVVEEEIRRTGFGLKFPDELEHKYRRDTAISRSHELRAIARIALAVFLVVGVFANLFLDLNPRWNLSLFYWGLMTAVMLLVQPYFRPAMPFLKRKAAIFGFCAAYCLSVIAMVSSQPTPFLLESFVFAALPLNFIIIFVRLPFPVATLLAAVTGGAYCVALLAHPDLSASHKAFLFGYLLALTLPTLVASHWLERTARRLYLHGLLHRLNYEHVLAQNAILTDLSYADPLTGTANRRRMAGELQRLCDKDDACATFLMVDIDWFKGFNDRYGHTEGDRCLQEVAACLAGALRGNDLLARLGGEEFGVLLPDLPMTEAVLVAERLRAAVASYPFMMGTRIVRITVSIGVAGIVAYDEPARVMEAAEKAMYRAKRAGRNRIGGPWMKVAAENPPPVSRE